MSALQTIIDAVALGSLYALVAMGIGLIFGVMRLVNFAQGELLTAGAYSLIVTMNLPLVVRIGVLFATVVAFALATDAPTRAEIASTTSVEMTSHAMRLALRGSGTGSGMAPSFHGAL